MKYDEWREPDKLILIQGWRRDGLNYEQIAKNMGINKNTLNGWIKKFPEIKQAIKKGEEVCIYEVENALYKAAIGYDVTETDQTTVENETTGERVTTKHARKRHIPPSVGAICFILKNRRSDKWQDKPVVVDTSALDRLDAILQEAKEAAKKEESKQEDIIYPDEKEFTQNAIQQEAE